jgi:hypothetical protein|tara:strand:+ start:506 stop:2341 length:1836 start_codon:yes stop_codon:yes gene_type:complete
MKYLLSLLLCVNIVFAQCPPGTWGLDITLSPDQYPEETSFVILNLEGDTILNGGPYTNIIDYQPQYASICLPIDTFIFILNDEYGDGVAGSLWGGEDGNVIIEQCGDTIWELESPDFGFGLMDTIITSNCPPPPAIYGCMDENFLEFLLTATVDTGMCITPKLFGCTDSLAFNYDAMANTDEFIDSCNHTLELTDLAGNGWAGSSLIVSQATNLLPPYGWVELGTYTLENGFDTVFNLNLSAGYKVKAVFEITQQSDFTAVQCGYSLYSEEYIAIDIEGGFVNPIPPFVSIFGEPYCGNECIERTYGCIDTIALNYNDSVNTDDGSCYYIAGCMNPSYIEYNELADFDDGSCITPIVLGCMDSTALNYNPEANVELEGSCIEVVEGCMDDGAFNYNPNANVDDGGCIPFIFGCIDPVAFNYCDTCNTDNGSCIDVINGCTDSLALNYNPLANTDNGSCILPLEGCTDITAVNYNINANIPDSSCYYESNCYADVPHYIPNFCFEWVVSIDPYCCDNLWDNTCVNLYNYCEDGWSGPTDLLDYNRIGLSVYPNPTNNTVYFTKFVNVQVYNSIGKLIIEKNNINSIDLLQGVYHIIIMYDNLNYRKTIIVND